MDTIQVSKSELTGLLGEATRFVGAAGEQLEKLSSHQSKMQTYSQEWAEKMAEAGLIAATDVDALAEEVNKGGLDKVAEIFDYVIKNVGARTLGKGASRQSTKSASAPTDRPETSEEVWMRCWNIKPSQ